MTKVLGLEDLQAKLIKASTNYANCGCKIYREEMAALKQAIKQLEDAAKTA